MFNEEMNSVLLFNEAEAISPLHVFKSSGLPLSSKGITKLIIEEKKWCIVAVHVSAFRKCSLSEQHRKHTHTVHNVHFRCGFILLSVGLMFTLVGLLMLYL